MLSKHYGEVGAGEVLAWFNAADHLEIAINMGKASSTLHLFANKKPFKLIFINMITHIVKLSFQRRRSKCVSLYF